MNKAKASYAIPVAGLLLTGCRDPIKGDWDLESLDGESMPISLTFSGTIYGYSYDCTVGLSSSSMAISKDLLANISFTYKYSCNIAGYSYSESETYSYTGTVTVDDKKVSYRISLSGAEQINLNCAMSDKAILNCNDDEGASWDFGKID